MKKRSLRDKDSYDSDENAEMVIEEVKTDAVENETENNQDQADVDDEDQEGDVGTKRKRPTKVEDSAFLDSFYGLSSSDPSERAMAASALLHHCLLGPSANPSDCAYAFKRLLNGVCSGRAAARQGNASVLSTFIKLALANGQMEAMKAQDESSGEKETILQYIRRRIVTATDSNQIQGKKKGAEERDYQFGRLFAILSVARSESLLPSETTELSDIIEVTSAYIDDLIQLYHEKKWMREPAAHAIGTILNSFYKADQVVEGAARKVVNHLVVEEVIPKMLSDTVTDKKDGTLFQRYSAEQIAIAANIQAHIEHHPDGLPAPLDEPVISVETMSSIAMALRETSSVTQPRTHLVWDTIWLYLTHTGDSSGNNTEIRKIKAKTRMKSESTHDVVESLMREVVVEKLLQREQGTGGTGTNSSKTTHERQALAICVVRNLLGATFMSSISGPTTLIVSDEVIDQVVLTPAIVKRLFINVICAGRKNQTSHHLKPLALNVLGSMVTDMRNSQSDDRFDRRLACAKSLILAEPKFDQLCKTSTISDLLGLDELEGDSVDKRHVTMLEQYLEFLERQVLLVGDKQAESSDENHNAFMMASGYVNLMHQLAKRLLRMKLLKNGDSEKTDGGSVSTLLDKILGFFMAVAFFESAPTEGTDFITPKKSKKKRKSKDPSSDSGRSAKDSSKPVVQAAARRQDIEKTLGKGVTIDYDIRCVLSERFYALLTEDIKSTIHLLSDTQNQSGQTKDSVMLGQLAEVYQGWQEMESAGFKTFVTVPESQDDDDKERSSPEKTVLELQALAKELAAMVEKSPEDQTMKSRKRCATGCATLAATLFLHLLHPGRPAGIMEEVGVTTEDEEETAEIVESIQELGEISNSLLDQAFESEENPLADFALLSANILSSRLCVANARHGASPKLIGDAIKFSWMGVLTLSAQYATPQSSLLRAEVTSVLLDAIGAADFEQHEEDEEMDDEEEEEEDDDENEDDSEDVDNSKRTNKSEEEDDDDDDNSEIEINQNDLQTLLEADDDDMDESILEHHEGADEALAKLIQLKQQARKAGQRAQERLEISKQNRCILLLETLIAKTDSWASLLRTDIVLNMSIPIVSYRNALENALSNDMGKDEAYRNDKSGLLDRLTALLKGKFFKVKLNNVLWTESVNMEEYAVSFSTNVLNLMRRARSKEQLSCYNGSLMLALKSIPDAKVAMKAAAEVYQVGVSEWSTKRTTKLDASLFDDFIHHCPSLAQATLLSSLVSATESARSPYLIGECFRLMSVLYNPKINPKSGSDLDEAGIQSVQDSLDDSLECIYKALEREDMEGKAKRIREVLKAAERVCTVLEDSSSSNSISVDKMERRMQVLSKCQTILEDVQGKSESSGIQKSCEKILKSIQEELQKTRKAFEEAAKKDVEMNDDEDDEVGNQNTTTGESSSSRKKKKKKKKRGKK